MTNKDFIVKVLLNKNNPKHTDATKPQLATRPGVNNHIGEFFQVSLLLKSEKAKIEEGKRKIFNIWDTGQRALIFDKLKNALADEKNYELDIDKNAILKDTAIYFSGELKTEKTPFEYYMTDTNGKHLVNGITKKDITRKFVQMFIFDFEDENGTAEVLLANEIDRAKRHTIESKTEGEGEHEAANIEVGG
jgi:hypothetical protein